MIIPKKIKFKIKNGHSFNTNKNTNDSITNLSNHNAFIWLIPNIIYMGTHT